MRIKPRKLTFLLYEQYLAVFDMETFRLVFTLERYFEINFFGTISFINKLMKNRFRIRTDVTEPVILENK